MKNLQMSLIKKWFDMTKELIKPEDYREIKPYWCNKFLLYNGKKETKDFWKTFISLYSNGYSFEVFKDNLTFKNFDFNIMTLGYPKSGDTERIIQFEHAGIEIRTGNIEWGAEPNKLYFVIKHGSLVE
jgi:hypothetical protein